jgi:hypothetical protein
MRFAMCGLALLGAGTVTLRAQPPAWVTLKGQVVLPAAVPIPPQKALAGAQGCPAGLKDESVIVDAKTRGVKNVVVWLRPDNMNPKATFAPNEINPADAKLKPETVVIDQPCCQFEPHVLAAGQYRIVYWHESSGFKGKAAGRFGEVIPIAGGANGTLVLKPTDFDVTK